MEKALQVIEEMTRQGIIKAYAIGGGIAATLKYRNVEAKVVTAEYLAAISLQTGRAKDRERVIRLLDEAVINRAVLGRILESFGLADKLRKIEKQSHEE